MPRLLPIVLLLVACGPLPTPVKPTKVVSRAEIDNEYAVSLFTLTVTPAGAAEIVLFTKERIESGKTTLSTTFDLPLEGSDVAFRLVGTSLGDNHTFTGTTHLEAGTERLSLKYDYDLAIGDFSVHYGAVRD